MTKDELERLILETRDLHDIRTALAGLDEKQRKALAGTVRTLHGKLKKEMPDPDLWWQLRDNPDGDPDAAEKATNWENDPLINATLALFALCPLSTVRKKSHYGLYSHRDVLTGIVLDRRPDWLDDWVAFELERDNPDLNFDMLRPWIREGACRKPDSDSYFACFLSDMLIPKYSDKEPRPPLSRQLMADPELLEDVWAAFRFADIAFAAHQWEKESLPEGFESWPDALVRLAEEGHLDRGRLLDASLDALWQDLKQDRIARIRDMHERLQPDRAERAERQAAYLTLLSHRTGNVVRMGLDMLGRIQADGALDTDAFLNDVRYVVLQDHKGNALAALDMIGSILPDASAPHASAGLAVAADALQNRHNDVQEKAVGILEEHRSLLDDAIAASIRQSAEIVAPVYRERVLALCAGPDSTPGETPTGRVPDTGLLEARAGDADPGAVDVYVPASDNVLEHRVLEDSARLEPVADVDELIALASHLVEVVESPDDLERLIDGISRLNTERPPGFKDKTASLLHRLESGATSHNGICDFGIIPTAIADLIGTWISNSFFQTELEDWISSPESLEPILDHLKAVTLRVAKERAAPLLSMPTHRGGWIDPVIWVRRLKTAEANATVFESIDVCFSLLRLAPDNRDTALRDAASVTGRYKGLANFALGGDARPARKDREAYDLWICAARARDPYADWRELGDILNISDTLPDSLEPVRYVWRDYGDGNVLTGASESDPAPCLYFRDETESGNDGPSARQGFMDRIRARFEQPIATDWRRLPCAALSRHVNREYVSRYSTGWINQWYFHVWPLNPGSPYFHASRDMARRLENNSSGESPNFRFLTALFQKNRPWREPGHVVLCLGLAGKDADCRGLAIDALIEGVPDGLFDPELFAMALNGLEKEGHLKPNRLAEALAPVAQASRLHALAVSSGLQTWLAMCDPAQKNLHHVLEVLLDAQTRAPQPLRQDTSEALRCITGSGKAAKLATALLAAAP